MPIPLGVLAVAGAGGGGGAAGAYELLATQTLANSTTDIVTFSNLNSTYGSTYQHLAFRLSARGSDANSGTTTALRMYMNGVGGSSYAIHMLRFFNGGSLAGESYSDAPYMFAMLATAQFGDYATAMIDLLDPFETTKFKTMRSYTGVRETGGSGNARGSNIGLFSGLFKSTDAVTSVSFQFNADWKFQQGSRLSMYGLRSS